MKMYGRKHGSKSNTLFIECFGWYFLDRDESRMVDRVVLQITEAQRVERYGACLLIDHLPAKYDVAMQEILVLNAAYRLMNMSLSERFSHLKDYRTYGAV